MTKCDGVTGETGDINSIERTKVDLEIVRRREVKWVEMMGSWDTYMMRSVETGGGSSNMR